MDKKRILQKAETHITHLPAGNTSGHGIDHIRRVAAVSEYIARKEGGDPFICRLAALLHDIADFKYHNGNITAGPKAAAEWMRLQQIDEQTVEKVATIIREISFKGAKVPTPMSTREGKIVQDADRLDALGAIGIARTFAYGGFRGHPIYDPSVRPVMHEDFEHYKQSTAPVINHFYEKLLLLKDLMNTTTGRKLAEERHVFMEEFLRRFFAEWNFPEKP